ncbi:hypothetical protein HMPREF1049_0034 [Fusobacterium necrophorum subsp. funduliforme ATCC 51357]|uniref:Lipoprotein n=1 Tax=Fusobacterium necrophorum subsp. funduliforme TaxID=143387 RepID=A0A170MVN3_9FUSO|nr:hypothetical protein [Fusobacterium necrophorum]AYV92275.1 hypothetical protein BSQ88_00665 [Fusobacterium necrophorum subsp. funduliforme]EIJ72046.1 hypothetical protein HMPREF1049_0034 [Fusobacterium necrophorum subsp. funduliforme ATCC 51357]KAB0553607.1 hypothetical protein F7P76_04615 [Fusobacterium necrophorum subsp. funduliforme]KYL03520.1 hypothetical protein A2J07_05560 [Fusobacterium necrophorum subsp. funduliforme]KYM43114.1 hypothetical protein A2U05_04560 [Fusobacterium necroph
MKKIFRYSLILCFALSVTGCFSLDARQSAAVDLSLNFQHFLLKKDVTLFEIEELFGEPQAKSDGHPKVVISYVGGDFYWKNSEKNRKILETHIPKYFLENKDNFNKCFLLFSFLYDEARNEYILNDVFCY